MQSIGGSECGHRAEHRSGCEDEIPDVIGFRLPDHSAFLVADRVLTNKFDDRFAENGRSTWRFPAEWPLVQKEVPPLAQFRNLWPSAFCTSVNCR
jgi:hypothetical protein